MFPASASQKQVEDGYACRGSYCHKRGRKAVVILRRGVGEVLKVGINKGKTEACCFPIIMEEDGHSCRHSVSDPLQRHPSRSGSLFLSSSLINPLIVILIKRYTYSIVELSLVIVTGCGFCAVVSTASCVTTASVAYRR
jgi:hypothetical protein